MNNTLVAIRGSSKLLVCQNLDYRNLQEISYNTNFRILFKESYIYFFYFLTGGQKGPRSEESEVPQQRRRYPDRSRSYSNSDPGAVFRNQNQNRNQQTSSFSQQQRSSNQQQISFNQQNSRNQQQSPIKQTQSFAYEPFPTNNNSRSNYQGAVHVIFELS